MNLFTLSTVVELKMNNHSLYVYSAHIGMCGVHTKNSPRDCNVDYFERARKNQLTELK